MSKIARSDGELWASQLVSLGCFVDVIVRLLCMPEISCFSIRFSLIIVIF